MFTVEEIQKLTSIVDFHNSFFAIQILGKEVLDDYDKFILRNFGIDIEKINNSTPHKGINYEKTKCFYCERKFNICQKTVEHIVPRSLGGSNAACNKVNACYDCNTWKGSLMIHDFILKVKKRIKSGKTHKTIPDDLLRVILINCARLKLYVDKKGQKLYAKQNITNPYAEPKKKKLKQIAASTKIVASPIRTALKHLPHELPQHSLTMYQSTIFAKPSY